MTIITHKPYLLSIVQFNLFQIRVGKVDKICINAASKSIITVGPNLGAHTYIHTNKFVCGAS